MLFTNQKWFTLVFGSIALKQSLSTLSVPLLPKPLIEVDVPHQLLIGRAGWIRSTRCSAPLMSSCRIPISTPTAEEWCYS